MANKTTKTEQASVQVSIDDVRAMNVYERLLYARVEFLNSNPKKTGRHLKPNYMYFKLEDIVPVALPIFTKYRLLMQTTFNDDEALAIIINIDRPDEQIIFRSPLKDIDGIESNATGGKLTNSMQDLGSAETYVRRYLYLTVLDITEHDDFDGNDDEDGDVPLVQTKKSPYAPTPTPTERTQIVEKLTNADGKATEEQLNALKTACASWRTADPTCEETIQNIALETNGFTEATKEACEALLIHIGNALQLLENGTTEG